MASYTVPHVAADYLPLVVTHAAAVIHYRRNNTRQQRLPIYTAGMATALRLSRMGYKDIRVAGSHSEQIQPPDSDYLWLHGDRFRRNFASDAHCQSLQTYRTETLLDHVVQVRLLTPERVYVYSQSVLTALEQQGSWPATELCYTASCRPVAALWQATATFDPSVIT